MKDDSFWVFRWETTSWGFVLQGFDPLVVPDMLKGAVFVSRTIIFTPVPNVQ